MVLLIRWVETLYAGGRIAGLSLRAQRGNLDAVAMVVARRVLNLTGIATSLTLLAMTVGWWGYALTRHAGGGGTQNLTLPSVSCSWWEMAASSSRRVVATSPDNASIRSPIASIRTPNTATSVPNAASCAP